MSMKKLTAAVSSFFLPPVDHEKGEDMELTRRTMISYQMAEDMELTRRTMISYQMAEPFPVRIMDAILNLLGFTGGRGDYYAEQTDQGGVQMCWEMPGLEKQDVKVYVVQKNTLVVKSRPRPGAERCKFFTQVYLDDMLYQTSAITAEMKNGLLKVVVPMKEGEYEIETMHVKVT